MVQSDTSFTTIRGRDGPPCYISAPPLQEPPTLDLHGTGTWTKNNRGCCFFTVVAIWGSSMLVIWIASLSTLAIYATTRPQTPTRIERVTNSAMDVVDGMANALDEPAVQTRGCIFLWALAENGFPDDVAPFQQRRILEAMERHRYHSQLQQQCLRAMENSSTRQNTITNKEKTLSVVLGAMSENQVKLEVQAHGIGVLSALDSFVLRGSDDVVPSVLGSMRRFPWSSKIVADGIEVLIRASDGDGLGVAMHEDASVAGRAASLLGIHTSRGYSKSTPSCQATEPSANESVVEIALDILAREEKQKPTQGKVRAQICQSTWLALKGYKSAEITKNSLRLLLALAETGTQANIFHGLTSNEADLILDSMASHCSNEEIQQHGSKLLESFSTYPQKKTLSVLMEAMRKHETNKSIVESCLSILARLDKTDSLRLFVHHGADLVLEALWRFQAFNEIQIGACKILSRYIEVSPSLPSADEVNLVVLRALDILSQVPSTPKRTPNERSSAMIEHVVDFYLKTMLYFSSNEKIQERCIAALVKLDPINGTTGFDIIRGAYRAFGSHNVLIRKGALAILERMGPGSAFFSDS